MAIRKKTLKKTTAKATTKKTAPKSGAKTAVARKSAAKKTVARKAAMKKGNRYVCGVCGLAVTVDTACGCAETAHLICCEKPMKPRK